MRDVERTRKALRVSPYSPRFLAEHFFDELLFDQIVHEAIVDGSGGEREILYRNPLTIDSSRALTIRPG